MKDTSKYAHITFTADGYTLSIGKDVPGLASHGAAVNVGSFFSLSEAIASAEWRGVPESRIAFDLSPLPGAEKFNS